MCSCIAYCLCDESLNKQGACSSSHETRLLVKTDLPHWLCQYLLAVKRALLPKALLMLTDQHLTHCEEGRGISDIMYEYACLPLLFHLFHWLLHSLNHGWHFAKTIRSEQHSLPVLPPWIYTSTGCWTERAKQIERLCSKLIYPKSHGEQWGLNEWLVQWAMPKQTFVLSQQLYIKQHLYLCLTTWIKWECFCIWLQICEEKLVALWMLGWSCSFTQSRRQLRYL